MERSAPRLSIILVTHNTCDDALACIRSIEENASIYETEIIVVDNASVDGGPEEVARHFPHVRVIENDTNAGYSRGVNRGIRESAGEFFLILNPDILVHEGALDRLVEHAAANSDVAIVGPKLLNRDGTVQYSCRRFYTIRTFLYRRTPLGRFFPDSPVLRDHLMLDWDHETNRDVDWMLGACLLVRRSAVDDVGLMDERFFLYFEDVDWCYRMKAHGWRVVYVADATMTHAHRRESAGPVWNRRTLMHLASLLRFYDKWSRFLYRLKSRRHVARFLFALVTDLVVINASFALAYGIRYLLGTVFPNPLFPFHTYLRFLSFVNLTTVSSLFFVGFYARAAGAGGAGLVTDRFIRALRAAGVAYLVVTAATFLTQSRIYSRILVTIYFVLLPFLLAWGRYLLHSAYRALRRGAYDLRRAIVVGNDEMARRVGEQFRAFPRIGYDLVGYVAENAGDKGAGVLGTTADLPRLVREHRVSDVLFVGGGDPLPIVSTLLVRLADAPVTVRVVSDLSAITLARGKTEEFLNLPVLRFDRRSLLGYRPGMKRFADFVIALFASVITLPVAAVALLLLLAGRIRPLLRPIDVPVFRGGSVRRPRFRVPPPGEGGVPGALARRLFTAFPLAAAIPSLYTVLSGRFSFVGPSPHATEEGRFLDEWQRLAATARPGLCDVGAVSEHRWVPFRDPLGLNVYYMQQWTVGLDLQIIIRELIRSFRKSGNGGTAAGHE